jgi:hypothetical protein
MIPQIITVSKNPPSVSTGADINKGDALSPTEFDQMMVNFKAAILTGPAGISVTGGHIDSGHIIFTLSDGSSIDFGAITVPDPPPASRPWSGVYFGTVEPALISFDAWIANGGVGYWGFVDVSA